MNDSKKKKGLPVIKYRGECPMHHLLDERYGPLVCRQCADEEIAKLKAELAEERAMTEALENLCAAYWCGQRNSGKLLDRITEIKARRAALDAARKGGEVWEDYQTSSIPMR